jgi:large subunit ribosomal protein L14e
MIEVGRVCMKTAGRESGKFCTIADVLGDGMVLITGPKAATGVKRRKCSIHHLEPTPLTIKIKKNAGDEEILAAYKHAGVFQKIGIKEPGAKEIEASKDAERKRLTEAKTAHKAEKKVETAVEAPKEEVKKAEKKPEHHKEDAHKAEKKEEHKKAEHKEAKEHTEKKVPAKKPIAKKSAKKAEKA